jgi:hypothetical protein
MPARDCDLRPNAAGPSGGLVLDVDAPFTSLLSTSEGPPPTRLVVNNMMLPIKNIYIQDS